MFQFADRNVKMFKGWGITDRKKGSGGNNKSQGRTVRRIKKVMVSKMWREIDHDKQEIDAIHSESSWRSFIAEDRQIKQ